MPLCYVILSKVVPCPLPSCFMLLSSAPSRPTMLPLQSGGTTRKQLALGREILYNTQSLQIFRPSSSMFPTTCATSTSLSEPTRVGNSHKMPTRSPSVDIPSKAIGLPGIMFATLGVSPAGCLGPNLYHLSPKVTNTPWINSPLHFYGTFGLLPQNKLVIKPVTNSYNQDSTPLQAMLLHPAYYKNTLMLLTGSDNPLLCHYFCYYLK